MIHILPKSNFIPKRVIGAKQFNTPKQSNIAKEPRVPLKLNCDISKFISPVAFDVPIGENELYMD